MTQKKLDFTEHNACITYAAMSIISLTVKASLIFY